MFVFFSTWFYTRGELLQEEIRLFGTVGAKLILALAISIHLQTNL